MSDILVDIQNLNKTFSFTGGIFNSRSRVVHAVCDVSLQIKRGKTLGLVGESGCGKSTLARLIARLENPSSGFILFKGKDIGSYNKKEMKEYRHQVQLIFQDPYSSLNPRKSAISMVREPLTIHQKGSRDECLAAAAEIMQKVGLSSEQLNRYPHEFSGGQRQRIGIARALVLRPELVIADEPVSALDVSVQAQILNLLKDLKQDFGLTYLFISHDLNVIRHMADRIAVMYLGRIVEIAGNNDIYDNPLHPYTRLLLSAVPDCNPRKKRKQVFMKDETDHMRNAGCSFQNRCSYKLPVCCEKQPLLQERGGNRLCACHRSDLERVDQI